MQPTDGTTTLPTNSQASHSQGRSGDQRGVISLEWLLIVGAVAGLAATSVLAVQRVVDDTSEVPVDPLVRVLEADIAAAFIAADADTAALSPPYTDAHFRQRCQRPAGRVRRRRAHGGVDAADDDPPGRCRRPSHAGCRRPVRSDAARRSRWLGVSSREVVSA